MNRIFPQDWVHADAILTSLVYSKFNMTIELSQRPGDISNVGVNVKLFESEDISKYIPNEYIDIFWNKLNIFYIDKILPIVNDNIKKYLYCQLNQETLCMIKRDIDIMLNRFEIDNGMSFKTILLSYLGVGSKI